MDFVNQPDSGVGFDMSNREDLQNFQRAFDFSPEKLKKIQEKAIAESADKLKQGDTLTIKNMSDAFFEYLPELMDLDKAKDWTANIHCKITNAGNYTMRIGGGKVTTQEGLVGEPTGTLMADFVTLGRMLNQLHDRVEEGELSDLELESVAGGKGAAAVAKGACGSDICGGVACGAAGCGSVTCGAAACGAAACGVDACPANVCAADACGLNVIPGIPGI
jgi:hypothetical protein